MFRELIGQGWLVAQGPRSTKYLILLFSIFCCFMHFFYNVIINSKGKLNGLKNLQSVFLAFLVAVPYEKPIDTPEDVLNRVERVHICKGRTSSVAKSCFVECNNNIEVEHMKTTLKMHWMRIIEVFMLWRMTPNMGSISYKPGIWKSLFLVGLWSVLLKYTSHKIKRWLIKEQQGLLPSLGVLISNNNSF